MNFFYLRGSFKSVSLLWASSILGSGSTFLLYVLLARVLGPGEFGIFGASYSISMMLLMLASFGVPQVWVKVFSRYGNAGVRWVRASLVLVLIASLLALALLFLWVFFGGHEGNAKIVLVMMSFFLMGQVFLELSVSKYQLEERYLFIAVYQLLPNFFRLVFVVFLFWILDDFNVVVVAAVYAITGTAIAVLSMPQILRVLRGEIDLGEGGAKVAASGGARVFEAFSEAWPFCLAAVFSFIYLQISVVILKYISGDAEAGVYNAAFVVIHAAIIFPSVLYGKFFFSKFHRWASHDVEKMRVAYRKGNVGMLLFGVAAMVFVLSSSWWFIPLLFGEQYSKAVLALNILALSLPAIFMAYSVGAVLTTGDHMRMKVLVMGVVAVFNLTLNALLVPIWGMMGAACCTVVSNFLLLFLYFILAKKAIAEVGYVEKV